MSPLPPAPQSPPDKPPADALPVLPTRHGDPPEPHPMAIGPPAASCRAYPWLLALSTAVAGLFCLMYITKPVSLAPPQPAARPSSTVPPSAAPEIASKPAAAAPAAALPAPEAGLLPNADRLPGDDEHRAATPVAAGSPATAATPTPALEETNLRIQHILTAEAPGGYLARIDLDVPVLYQSRNLRWTPEDVAEGRKLLAQLMDYQENSSRLRSEGEQLLQAWNRLIHRSLPTADLRADSPSLPANQKNAATTTPAAGLITSDSIQIQPTGK